MKIGLPFAAAVAAASALATAAAADTPQAATGTGVFSLTPTSVQQAGPNTIIEGIGTATMTGTITGLLSTTFRWVIHEDGRGEFEATGSITGSVDGCDADAVSVRVVNTGTIDDFSGKIVTTGRASSSANAHFVVDDFGTAPTFAYSGTYHCG